MLGMNVFRAPVSLLLIPLRVYYYYDVHLGSDFLVRESLPPMPTAIDSFRSANSTAMLNGGSVTLVYGMLVCFLGALITAASLAEMVSM